jgi:hypothetical protein
VRTSIRTNSALRRVFARNSASHPEIPRNPQHRPELRTILIKGGEDADVRIAIPMRQISFSQFGDTGTCLAGDQTVPCDDD